MNVFERIVDAHVALTGELEDSAIEVSRIGTIDFLSREENQLTIVSLSGAISVLTPASLPSKS